MMRMSARISVLMAVSTLYTASHFLLPTSANNLSINADEKMELYYDGNQVKLDHGNEWNVPDRVDLPPGTQLIAVHAQNSQDAGCIVASDSDGLVFTDWTWKYKIGSDPGWEKPGYDDRGWKRVTVVCRNDGLTWTRMRTVNRFAFVVWSPNITHDRDVYFRYRIRNDRRVRNYELLETDKQVDVAANDINRLSRLQCATLCGQLALESCSGFQYASARRSCRLLNASAILTGHRTEITGWNIYSAIDVTEPCC